MSRLLPVVLVSALLVSACDSAPTSDAQPSAAADGAGAGSAAGAPPPLPGKIVRYAAGEMIPDLTVAKPDGEELSLRSVGQPVLLNLWATWCAPCKVEMPLLDRLAGELDGEVRVLTVSQDIIREESDTAKVTDFFAQEGFERLEPWLDPRSDLGVTLTQGGLLPTTVLYDAEGKELFRVAGDYEWDSEEAIAAIREAIAE